MLGINENTPAPAGDLIKDSSEAEFMADVIEASQEVPVVVDFWAPWCGPCKTLGPALEAAVTAARGKVRMVKINVDDNQALAGQLRIQSIPTVYAFFEGRPVDAFQGALPPSELKTFIDKLAALAGDDGLGAALEEGEKLLTEGAATDAAQLFAAILAQIPENAAAFAGLARAHIAMGELDQAEALLANAQPPMDKAQELETARAQLALARQASDAGPVDTLRATVEEAPDNHQARFDLAQALYARGDVEAAIDTLLELFRRDREWNDGAAKTQLFTIFDALKPTDPLVQKGRRRLTSMIFA
ncbi:MAG TPA: co-chaperone YbbN [Paracoccus sp.]|nr:co-chaperone YbbN [Paracoccus sp. (in: a-proteobacteria)]